MTRDPHLNAPCTSADITEPMIQNLVCASYARVRVDPLLGPIFNAAVGNWDEHLDKLCAFWISITLMTGRYQGYQGSSGRRHGRS